ncbi:MAPEG family protein [Congregibacter variabilis]|uniref:MAPEG family protein n=1 Tax=Congregibacter variabilis TaxID=3081200 RepID=A0ABZ0I6Y5_9GAMM|nr:MAPEG family protein [Congregibacter sp. IMCC43200]
MENNLIFAPVALQVALTLWLYIALAIAKSGATKRGEVNEERRALHDDAWPDSVLKINNNIRNQFELPMLFYVLVIVLWSMDAVNTYVHISAWAFVVSRIVHMTVHTGSNYVPLRRRVFMLGGFILIGLVGFLAYKLITG